MKDIKCHSVQISIFIVVSPFLTLHTEIIMKCIKMSINVHRNFAFWATICQTVLPMLSDRCLCCPVCDVGVLWPNGWMDQDEAWHAGRPRPWPQCVR